MLGLVVGGLWFDVFELAFQLVGNEVPVVLELLQDPPRLTYGGGPIQGLGSLLGHIVPQTIQFKLLACPTDMGFPLPHKVLEVDNVFLEGWRIKLL